MKNWMKILMWAGLSGGIGFFAGYQIGAREKGKAERAAYEEGKSDGFYDCAVNSGEYLDAFENVRKEYEGTTQDEPEDEEPPMPEEPPTIGDEAEIEEIPQLHPQHLVPVQITEEEYYENPWHYDQESLIFYEMDEVLFNKDTREAMTTKDDQDQVVGIGMLFNFYLKDGESLDTIFVKNDTMGTIFRIDRMDAAYMDEGADPEYEEEDLD
jgi:hypothetical protein